jgi:hypothetical protein
VTQLRTGRWKAVLFWALASLFAVLLLAPCAVVSYVGISGHSIAYYTERDIISITTPGKVKPEAETILVGELPSGGCNVTREGPAPGAFLRIGDVEIRQWQCRR